MTHPTSTASTRPGRRRLGGALVLALTLLALACGSDDDADRSDESAPPGDGPADQRATDPADPGAFPEEPQLVYDLSEPPDGWPAEVTEGGSSARFDHRGLALQAEDDPLWLAAPDEVEPGHRGVLLEAQVALDDGGGSVGVFCRGSPDPGFGYALTVGPERHWSLWRFEDDSQAVLADGTLTEADLPDAAGPVPLVLICGAGLEDQQVTVGFAVGPTTLVVRYDGLGLPAGSSTRVGFLALPDGDASGGGHAATLAVSLAEAETQADDEAGAGG